MADFPLTESVIFFTFLQLSRVNSWKRNRFYLSSKSPIFPCLAIMMHGPIQSRELHLGKVRPLCSPLSEQDDLLNAMAWHKMS